MSLLKGKTAFLIAWAIATGGLAFSIYHDTKVEVSGEAVGAIEKVIGNVQVKPDAKIIWRDAFQGQLISFNDSISTGPSGEATINIKNTKPLRLGPNSVITLKSQSAGSKEITIDLSRGFLEAEKGNVGKNNSAISKGEVTSIQIRAGTSTYSLSAKNSELSLFKDSINGNAKVVGASGSIVLKEDGKTAGRALEQVSKSEKSDYRPLESSTVSEIDLSKDSSGLNSLMMITGSSKDGVIELKQPVALAPTPPPKKIQEPPKKPVIDTTVTINNDLVPRIIAPGNGSTGWIDQPLSTLGSQSIAVTIEPPKQPPTPGSLWRPFVGAVTPGALAPLAKVSIKEWFGAPELRQQTILINLAEAQGVLKANDGPEPQMEFAFKPGCEVSSTGSPQKTLGILHTVKFNSMQSLAQGAIRLGFDRWNQGAVTSVRWEKMGPTTHAITIKYPADLGRLNGLMQNGAFSLTKSAGIGSSPSIYLVRKREVIARLDGTPPPGGLGILRQLLGAELAFYGSAESYISGPVSFNDILNSTKDPSAKIYVLTFAGKTVGIDQEFIKDPAVQDFLKSGNATFFKGPIQKMAD